MSVHGQGQAVIVGAGITGVSAAEGLRAAGWTGAITVVGDEPELPYRRPALSKEILVGTHGLDAVRIKKPEWYAAHDVALVTGREVVGLDPDARHVTLGGGERLPYDVVLLATGGRARTLPVARAGGGRVVTLRSAGDALEVRRRLVADRRVIIVGAGLVGSEIAASAVALGASVTMLESGSRPLATLLPRLLGDRYARLHKEQGVELQTDVAIAAISESDSAATVLATDGRSWSAPVVIVAVGMEPNVDMARAAGLAVDNGIVVDSCGQTSAPRVFAAGDVANLPDGRGGRHRVEHWQHAQRHGLAVGRAMAGAIEPYVDVPWCWSNQYGLNLQVTGWPGRGADLVVRGSVEDLDFTALALDDVSRVVGAIGIGRPADIRLAREWIADRLVVDVVAFADETLDHSASVKR